MQKVATKKIMEKGGQNPFNPWLWIWGFNLWQNAMEDMAGGYLKKESFRKLLESDVKVDAVVTLYPTGAFLADHFDCPIIHFTPSGPIPMSLSGTGNVINLSVQPIHLSPFIEPMGFVQRVQNHFFALTFDLFNAWLTRSVRGYQSEQLGTEIRHPYKIYLGEVFCVSVLRSFNYSWFLALSSKCH
jgi:hypothetical protein